MSASITTSPDNSFSSKDSYEAKPFEDIKLLKRISKGKFPVFLAYSNAHRESYALKLYPYKNNEVDSRFYNEVRFSALSHPNMIGIVHAEVEREAKYGQGRIQKSSYLLLELAPYGDFYDMIREKKVRFDEKMVRTYFHQLIDGLEYLHSQGVAHLDLKAENLLLGENFLLKIADFDYSYVEGDENVQVIGTKNYRAPEVINNRYSKYSAVDIYSAAVILFSMKCGGVLPFIEELFEGINLYGLLQQNQERFWNKHMELQLKKESFFDEDFKELFFSMTKPNPDERATISEIKNSKWYRGPVLSQDELSSILKPYFPENINKM